MEPSVAAVPGAPVEERIAVDLARRGALVAVPVVAVSALVAGPAGAAGAAVALAVVVANFAAAGVSLSAAARISAVALATAALGGYVVRLALVTLVALALRGQSWIDFGAFAVVLVVAHLGLLTWELRAVGLTLAAPGLRSAPDQE